MKSIKPGRYNSGQGIIASIIGLVFAVFWTITAAISGAPVIFPIFGAGFIVLMITELVKNIHNFTQKNRYSEFDIVDSSREPDPWDEKNHGAYNEEQYAEADGQDVLYCPYCGVKLARDFEFCPKCGRKIPDEINY